MSGSVQVSQELLRQWTEEFEELRNAQMDKGQEYEQGDTPGWQKNNLFSFVAEELADLANYAQLMYYRMRLCEVIYGGSGVDPTFQLSTSVGEPQVPPTFGPFVTRAEVPGFLPDSARDQDPG
jgi:hypothetical protein